MFEVDAHEYPYRVATFLLCGAFLAVWLRAAVQAGITRRLLYSHREGVAAAIFIRLFISISITSATAYIISPQFVEFARANFPSNFRSLGIVVCLAAILLIHRVFNELGHFFSTSLALQHQHRLIKSGPYKAIRHPMYTAYLLFWIGLFLTTNNVLIGVTGMIAFGFVMTVRLAREEEMMIEHFGDQYRDYMNETGRFLPRLKIRRPAKA